eukprot:1729538-Pyramimonas_sp.AAC.1
MISPRSTSFGAGQGARLTSSCNCTRNSLNSGCRASRRGGGGRVDGARARSEMSAAARSLGIGPWAIF